MLTVTQNFITSYAQRAVVESAVSASLSQASFKNEDETPADKVRNEMERRNSIAYVIGRSIGKAIGTVKDEPDTTKTAKRAKNVPRQNPVKATVPFIEYYTKLFPQGKLKVLYTELDPGVDDGAALLQLLAAQKNSTGTGVKSVEIVGIIPSCGNAILPQTIQNTMQFLELTGDTNIPVYAGAVAPLADQNNQTAINIVNQGINATHFYGDDGEEDVGGWPRVTMKLQAQPGVTFAADAIASASPDAPLTLVSTSVLTELAQILAKLDSRGTSFAKNINAISIMGGCVNATVTKCNAPFNVPDSQKNSEANFYFDPLAAQIVFSICQKHTIPIFLSPLDLTQQPGLLWTKTQGATLEQIGNRVANQWVKVTNVVPYLDVPCFPNGTYPMHDLQAASCLLYPNMYMATRASYSIGKVGELIENINASDAEKNVYILSMPPGNQSVFYTTLLTAYKNFNQAKQGLFSSIGKIVTLAAAGLGFVGTSIFGAIKLRKWVCKSKTQDVTEKSPLIQV